VIGAAVLGLPRATTQLAEQLDLGPTAVSQHLKLLKQAALVTIRADQATG
jgi:DNA-binding transcriptional ArsR family regulator